jgi:catechol 2,3-dioxygenase-like lactoylglutathione lyase family enzyme
MPVEGFSHYNLRASREVIEELRDFYIEIVGLRLGDRPPLRSFGYWLYAKDQAVLHLSASGEDETRPTKVTSTFDHVAFSCTDMAGYQVLLQERGISFTRRQVPGTNTHQIFFSDPAGNGVELNFANGV